MVSVKLYPYLTEIVLDSYSEKSSPIYKHDHNMTARVYNDFNAFMSGGAERRTYFPILVNSSTASRCSCAFFGPVFPPNETLRINKLPSYSSSGPL